MMNCCRANLLLILVLCLARVEESNSFRPSISSQVRHVKLPFHTEIAAVNGERPSSDESVNYNYIGLNTNKAPYIPSGLNPEQYQKIKEDEAARLAKMNYGAWGPRFKRTEAPDGDWMVQTSLWVKGFQTQGTPLTKEDLERQETRQKNRNAMKEALSSLVLGYAVVDIFLHSFGAIRSASSTKNILFSIVARQGVLQALQQHAISSFFVLSKLQLFKLTIAGLATPVINNYREIANRRWLWSKRRTFGTPILAAVALVAVKISLGFGLASL